MSLAKMRFWWIFGVILIALSIAFASLPLLPNSSLDVIRITVRQRALEERIVKDAMMLAYQPSNRVQAIGEIQNMLPTWEKVQTGLLSGDASLGIPPNPPEDVTILLLQAQSDYVSIDTAVHQILAHPSDVDPVQLAIILQHESGYYTTMAHAEVLNENHILVISKIYFCVELAIILGVLAIWIPFARATWLEEKDVKEDHSTTSSGEGSVQTTEGSFSLTEEADH